MALYFITSNDHKFKEVSSVIPGIERLNLELDEIQSLDPQKVIEHKLSQAAALHSGAFIVEDTSVQLACLNGFPGTLCKWFMDSLGVQGISELVLRYPNHAATVLTTIGYRDSAGVIHYFEGKSTGKIVAARGVQGFGFDPIFQADGQTKTSAELTTAQKSAISARGKVARALATHLKTHA